MGTEVGFIGSAVYVYPQAGHASGHKYVPDAQGGSEYEITLDKTAGKKPLLPCLVGVEDLGAALVKGSGWNGSVGCRDNTKPSPDARLGIDVDHKDGKTLLIECRGPRGGA